MPGPLPFNIPLLKSGTAPGRLCLIMSKLAVDIASISRRKVVR